MGDHARLSPSNTRWPVCPGSIEAESEYPDIPNSASIDGTGSHLLLEFSLEDYIETPFLAGSAPRKYFDEIIGLGHEDKPEGWRVDQERIDRVSMAISYVARRKKELLTLNPDYVFQVWSEQKVNPGAVFGRKDWDGTCDIKIILLDHNRRILLVETVDYKDGRLFVPADNNSQLESYAIGIMAEYLEFDGKKASLIDPLWDFNVRMTIVQPKTTTPIRYEQIKASEMVERANALYQAARRTDDENAPLVPDEQGGKGHCRWCKHKQNCHMLKGSKMQNLKAIPVSEGSLFESLSHAIDNVSQLDSDKLSEILDAEQVVMGLFEEVKIEAQKRVESGNSVPGYGMVPSRVTRVWNDDQEVIAKMLRAKKLKKDDIWTTKFASPAQILKNKKLNERQIARIKDFITEKYGPPKFGKMKKQPPKTTMSLFEDIPKKEDATKKIEHVQETITPPSFI